MNPILALVFTYHLAKSVPAEALRLQGSVVMAASGSVRSRSRASRASAPQSSAAAVPAGPRADNKLGVYLSAGSVARQKFLDETLDKVVQSGGSSVVMDVKGSFVYFDAPTAVMAREKSLIKPLYSIQEVVDKAHAKGLYVIGRYIALKDAVFSARVPEAQIRNPKTGRSVGDVWVDGGAQATIDYNRQILRDLYMTGIDEVNFDYIRFPTEYSKAAIGRTREEKTASVEHFLQMARETVNAVNPRIKLGISSYAIIGWNYDVNVDALGQDVTRFAPLLDVISPMAYPNSFAQNAYYRPGVDPRSRMYYLVWRTLDGYARQLGPEQAKKLRPWIQGYFVSAKDMRDQMDAVYAAGLCGFQVWNANNNYGPAYAAMKNLPEPPERCRGGGATGVPSWF